MICAWIVTSRAVVGSSQMRIFGWQESAIAMTIRWRMPPEYWNGYSSKRLAAFWMPTRSMSSMACFFASPREMPWCFSMTSVICEPIVRIGFSDVIGSWKIVEIFAPRMPSQSLSVLSLVRSLPSNMTEPLVMEPLDSSMPVNVLVKTLLPEPDSPTMANVSPS